MNANKARIFWLSLIFALLSPGWVQALQVSETPLEKIGYTRISRSAEISTFLQEFTQINQHVRFQILGHSTQGKAIEALIFARDPAPTPAPNRLKLMIVGSQHGAAEPAGGEAMLVIAREMASGNLRQLLDTMDVMLIPNANPDGRDLGRRSNGERINLNMDFVLLSQPESRVLAKAVHEFQPDVLLDTHESAIFKRRTLAKEGYVTDFYTQFESANNPALPGSARRFAFDTLLPAILERASQQGLPAHRYIGEITSTHQPITNGGLTTQNFRNMASFHGAFSFLLETRLESSRDSFPTYRNIGERIERQLICLRAFLDVVQQRQREILSQVDQLRADMLTEPVTLKARYVRDTAHPEVGITLRKLDDNVQQTLMFRDHRQVKSSDVVELPRALAIVQNTEALASWLEKQQITYERVQAPRVMRAFANRFQPSKLMTEGARLTASAKVSITLQPGNLLVDMSQPLGRLAFLLLDPRSSSSVFRYPGYAQLLVDKAEFFIYPLI